MKCSAKKLIGFGGCALAILLGGFLLLNGLVETSVFQAWARKAAQDLTGLPLRIGEIRYLPPTGLVFRKVMGELPQKEGQRWGEFSIEELHIHFSFGQLLRKKFVVDAVTIFQAAVSIREIEDIVVLFISAISQRTSLSEKNQAREDSTVKDAAKSGFAEPAADAKSPSLGLEVRKFRVAESAVDIRDERGAEIQFRGLHFEGHRDSKGEGLMGSAEVELIAYGKLPPFEKVRCQFGGERKVLQLEEIRGEFAQGKLRGKGELDLSKNSFGLDLTIEKGEVGAFLEELGFAAENAKGEFDIKLDINIHKKNFFGEAKIQFRGIEFESQGEVREIGRMFRIRELERLVLEDGEMRLVFDGERAKVEGLGFGTEQFRVESNGEIGLKDGSIDLPSRLLVRTSILRRLGDLAPKCFEPAEKEQFQQVRFSVRGTLSNPQMDLWERLGLDGCAGPIERMIRGFLRTPVEPSGN